MGTIVHRVDTEQYVLRRALIDEYRAWSFYNQHVAQRLRPVWHRLSERYGWCWTTDFWRVETCSEKQQWAEEDGGAPRDAELAAYIEAVRETVRKHMGLTVDGAAAEWALPYVQADAARVFRHDWAPDPVHAAFWKWEQLGISLRLTEQYAQLSVTRHDGATEELPELTAPVSSVFRDWGNLRRQAHALVDRELDRIQQEFERSYFEEAQYRRRYQGARDHRDDIALLRVLLTATPNRQIEIDPATRERLRRLCDPKKEYTIGIDFPTERRTKARRR